MSSQVTPSKQAKLAEAIRCHKAGDLEAAEGHYNDLLSADPREPDALHLFGVLAHQTGRVQLAIEAIGRAIACGTPHSLMHYNLGLALSDAGRLDAAEMAYRQAVQIDPHASHAQLNLGALLERRGRLEEACDVYRGALQVGPQTAELLCNLGSTLQRLGRLEESIRTYEEAIRLDPAFATAHANLGTALRDARRLEDARRQLLKCLEIAPEYFAAWHNLGQVLHELNQPQEAIKCYRRAMVVRPRAYETLVNLASSLNELARAGEAIDICRAALAIRPDGFEALNNLGLAYQELGRFSEALKCFDAAIASAPADGQVRLNRTLVWIQTGKLSDGWRDYEWRTKSTEAVMRPRNLAQPVWQGEPLKGRTILVIGEQGVGDEIMFASCLDDLIAEAGHCIITCDRRLETLFARSFPAASILAVDRGKEDWSALSRIAADFHIAAGSVPRFVRPTLESFPHRQAYLAADRERAAVWRRRFEELGHGLKIGISWRAGVKAKERRQRSTPLDVWQALANVPNVHFVNLQYGTTADELTQAEQQSGLKLHTWTDVDSRRDLDEVAAQCAALDLLISVGNSTVHMAGALGTPVWNLLPSYWGWRWLIKRSDSPWYPSMRLFRQPIYGDWASLFTMVRNELCRWSRRRAEANHGAFPDVGGSGVLGNLSQVFQS